MTEICVVTTVEGREPLLYLCLEAIRHAEKNLEIHVSPDRGYISPELSRVCHSFRAHIIGKRKHDFYGNSFNTLTSCQWALTHFSIPGIVHLVEDDTIVAPAWFHWADMNLEMKNEQTQEFLYAAVCARTHGDRSTVWYESPCASWNVSFLREALRHIPEGYFCNSRERMQQLLDLTFARSQYRYGSAEQDGFFLRCIEAHKWRTNFPPICMAQHIGFYGYNRQGHAAPTGSLEERIAFCRALLGDREKRCAMFGQAVTDIEMDGAAQ